MGRGLVGRPRGARRVRSAGHDRSPPAGGPRALLGLRVRPEVVLLDGPFDYISDPVVAGTDRAGRAADVLPLGEPPTGRRRRRRIPPVRTVVDGDALCVSIAAASIVAKVTRDRLMREMSESFPAFDFDRNKGYPSPTHRTALAGYGLSSVHRRSWSFVDGMAFR